MAAANPVGTGRRICRHGFLLQNLRQGRAGGGLGVEQEAAAQQMIQRRGRRILIRRGFDFAKPGNVFRRHESQRAANVALQRQAAHPRFLMTRAKPKSASFPFFSPRSSVTSKLAGFTSRWTNPF